METLDFLVTAQISSTNPCIDVIAYCPNNCNCNAISLAPPPCPMLRIAEPIINER